MILKRNISKHLPLECLDGHVLVDVNPYVKGAQLWHRYLKWQSFQKQWFQDLRSDFSRYIVPLLNEGNILSFGDNLSTSLIKKTNPNFISKLLPLNATMNILIIISYIIKLERLEFEL